MKHVVQPFPLKKVSKTHATPPSTAISSKSYSIQVPKREPKVLADQ